MTKKILVASFALLSISFAGTAFTSDGNSVPSKTTSSVDSTVISVVTNQFDEIYDYLNLGALKLNKEAFHLAVKGFEKLKTAGKINNPDILTIVDFSQASTSKRMYILDLHNKKLLEHSLVAHGRNTGQLMATSFSNNPESNQSSLGFYVTSETYQGKHGLSLRLDGMEKNINDNARNRAIVVHGAEYATDGFCRSAGYLGRSFGCPAVPAKVSKTIINTIRNGSCLFIYSPSKTYLKQSTLVA
jgi:hypothetical protein